MEAVAAVRSSARLVHGERALAHACGTEAREEASRASREASEEARAARLSLQKGAGDATGQPRSKRRAAMAGALCAWWPRPGHTPPIEAFYQARGGQQSDQRGA